MSDDGLDIPIEHYEPARRKFWEQVFVACCRNGHLPPLAADLANEALGYWDSKWS